MVIVGFQFSNFCALSLLQTNLLNKSQEDQVIPKINSNIAKVIYASPNVCESDCSIS